MPRHARSLPYRRSAYTLLELLIVIAVLGLAGALVVPHLVGRESMNVQAAVRMIISDLSFAQSDALAHQEYRRVYFYDDGHGYCIVRVTDADFDDDFDAASADYIDDPLTSGGTVSQYIVDFAANDRFEGVTIQSIDIDSGERAITYDQIGGTVRSGGNPGLGGTIVVSSPEDTYTIHVAPFTGKLTVD